MTIYLVRPYPIDRLAEAQLALVAAVNGDVRPMSALYRAASDALDRLDPDEVMLARAAYPLAGELDRTAARAAVACAASWEETVSVGSTIRDPDRFRGFAWLAAQVRAGLAPANPDIGRIQAFARGAPLPRTSAADSALYAIVPALIGLGPELADELVGPCPLAGDPVWKLLGLTAQDWAGIDPLDGIAVTPQTCRAAYATVDGAWRNAVARGATDGLLVRIAPPEELER